MSSASPPIDWSVINGTWGTHFDRDESNSESGAYALEFTNDISGAVTPELAHALRAIDGGKPYRLSIRAKSTSTTSSHHIIFKVYWYQRDGVTAASTASTTVKDSAAANTSYNDYSTIVNVPSNAAYCRIHLAKTLANFTVYVDGISVNHSPLAFKAYSLLDQSISTGNNIITFDAEIFDYGGMYDITSNSAIIQVSGIYTFQANLFCKDFDSLTSNSQVGFRNGLSLEALGPFLHPVNYNASGRYDQYHNLSYTGFFNKGDTVYLQIRTDDTCTSTLIDNSALTTYFSGYKVE